MQAFDSTTYELRIYASESAQAVFQCSAADGYTEDFMIAFAQTLKKLDWPAGQVPTTTLTKAVSHEDLYKADLTATSPVFT